MSAVKQGKWELKFESENIQRDREIAMATLNQNGRVVNLVT